MRRGLVRFFSVVQGKPKSKVTMRKQMRKTLRSLSAADLASESEAACARAAKLEAVTKAVGISVYLAMPAAECLTAPLLHRLFKQGNKEIFVPRVEGPGRSEMRMLRVLSQIQLDSFSRSSWGIPEPTADEATTLDDGLDSASIDAVIVPAVAFDSRCHRLGQGRGYYGTQPLLCLVHFPRVSRVELRACCTHTLPHTHLLLQTVQTYLPFNRYLS